MEKVKKSGLKLTGKERAEELNRKLIEKLNSDNHSKEKIKQAISTKLQTQGEIWKQELVNTIIEFGINDIEPIWFEKFSDED